MATPPVLGPAPKGNFMDMSAGKALGPLFLIEHPRCINEQLFHYCGKLGHKISRCPRDNLMK